MDQEELMYLERKIIIGAITDLEFLKKAHDLIQISHVQSPEARLLLSWCFEFLKHYDDAPGKHIEDIYMKKLRKSSIPKTQAEFIEEILESLSEEFEDSSSQNTELLTDQLKEYVKVTKITEHIEEIQECLENGEISEAEAIISRYTSPESADTSAIVPLADPDQIKEAFSQATTPLIKYPGELGRLLNHTMVREGFVVFLGQNKIGKSYYLLDAVMRGVKQAKKVFYVQAGDMSEANVIRRNGIYITRTSDMKEYCGLLHIPVLDCACNLNGDCNFPFRKGGKDAPFPFDGYEAKKIRDLSKQELIDAFNDYEDHVPCYECKRKKKKHFMGCIWYKERPPVKPLTWKKCNKVVARKYKSVMEKYCRMIVRPSDTLTTAKLNAELDILSRQGFDPDIIITDYMELLASDKDTKNLSTRDQSNATWQRCRRIAQERKALFLSVSQCDTPGFDQLFLTKKNFSEDKRKLDHVTAMFGINMTTNEKKKGVARINDIVSRETEGASFVYTMHRLQIGQPILGSFR